MTTNHNESEAQPKETDQKGNDQEQPLPVHNPLNPSDPHTITQQDIDNEQKYKEALTERD